MKKMKINGLDWKVMFTDKIESKDTNEAILGITDITKLKIYIVKSLPKKLVRRTLTHELCHAFLFSFGYTAEEMNEENVCDFVECHCATILKDVETLMYQYEIESI